MRCLPSLDSNLPDKQTNRQNRKIATLQPAGALPIEGLDVSADRPSESDAYFSQGPSAVLRFFLGSRFLSP
jgi:hypothetical protein